jgi:nicotinate phosphoribosyltransferase
VSSGLRPAAVRLDSGDLGALSRGVRAILDEGGLQATKIFASGDLDEDRIADLLAHGAPIDAFGVGTSLSTSRDSPALGGVYKLVEVERDGRAVPVLKLSPGKRTYAGSKQVWRVGRDGAAVEDLVGVADEPHAGGRPLLARVVERGRPVAEAVALEDVQRYCRTRIAELPADVRRLRNWTAYPVRISDALEAMSDRAVVSRPTGAS